MTEFYCFSYVNSLFSEKGDKILLLKLQTITIQK